MARRDVQRRARSCRKSAFESWATTTEAMLAQNTKYLPPFAWTYVPDANGADGGYYPDTDDPYSPVETYGAPTPGRRRLTMAQPISDDGGQLTDGARHRAASRGWPSRASTPARCRCTAQRRPSARRGCARTSCGRPPARSADTLFGHWLGDVIAGQLPRRGRTAAQNNVAIVLGLVFGVVGWLAGIGALNYPLVKLFGREPAPRGARRRAGRGTSR